MPTISAYALSRHFAQSERHKEAKRIRHEALAGLAVQEGVTQRVAAASVTEYAAAAGRVSGGSETTRASSPRDEPELVAPDLKVLIREPSVIGDKRLEFEPWAVVQVGGARRPRQTSPRKATR